MLTARERMNLVGRMRGWAVASGSIAIPVREWEQLSLPERVFLIQHSRCVVVEPGGHASRVVYYDGDDDYID